VCRDSHSGLRVPAPQYPSVPWSASKWSPRPSVATFARSAATAASGAWVRSRSTCQRMAGSESSSHCMTALSGVGECRVGGVVAMRWSSLRWVRDADGGSPSVAAKEDESGPDEHCKPLEAYCPKPTRCPRLHACPRLHDCQRSDLRDRSSHDLRARQAHAVQDDGIARVHPWFSAWLTSPPRPDQDLAAHSHRL